MSASGRGTADAVIHSCSEEKPSDLVAIDAASAAALGQGDPDLSVGVDSDVKLTVGLPLSDIAGIGLEQRPLVQN